MAIVTGIETIAMTFTKQHPPGNVIVPDAYADACVSRGGQWLLVNAQHPSLR